MSKMPSASLPDLLYALSTSTKLLWHRLLTVLQYIMSRMPTPMSTKESTAAPLPGSEPSIKVTLRSLRNPPIDISLISQPLTTSVHEIKAEVSKQARVPADKIKLLLNKRPVQDSKILKEVIDQDGAVPKSIEFSVMVMGGAAAVLPDESDKATQAASTASKVDDAFWGDLKGFLTQRLKDESLSKDMATTFQASWASKTSAP